MACAKWNTRVDALELPRLCGRLSNEAEVWNQKILVRTSAGWFITFFIKGLALGEDGFLSVASFVVRLLCVKDSIWSTGIHVMILLSEINFWRGKSLNSIVTKKELSNIQNVISVECFIATKWHASFSATLPRFHDLQLSHNATKFVSDRASDRLPVSWKCGSYAQLAGIFQKTINSLADSFETYLWKVQDIWGIPTNRSYVSLGVVHWTHALAVAWERKGVKGSNLSMGTLGIEPPSFHTKHQLVICQNYQRTKKIL